MLITGGPENGLEEIRFSSANGLDWAKRTIWVGGFGAADAVLEEKPVDGRRREAGASSHKFRNNACSENMNMLEI